VGQLNTRFFLAVTLLSLNPAFAAKQKSSSSRTSNTRNSDLDRMFNSWAVNKFAINGPGYLKAADSLSKDEYEALKVYFNPIATTPVKDMKAVQELAQDRVNVNGLFNKIESKSRLSAQDVVRWKNSLDKLHKRLLTALELRVGSAFNYSEFLREEQQRKLGSYQAAYIARNSLSKKVPRILDSNEVVQEELWTQTQRDPHTEMLIRMRQGVEILHAVFMDYDQQYFQRPEKQLGKSTSVVDTPDDASAHLRTDGAPFNKGPNPLLPPPGKED